MHCFVRQRAVCRAGNAHAGEVKVIDAAGSEGELLFEIKLCRQLDYIRRNAIAGRVQFPIAAKRLNITVGISLRAGQTVGRRPSEPSVPGFRISRTGRKPRVGREFSSLLAVQ